MAVCMPTAAPLKVKWIRFVTPNRPKTSCLPVMLAVVAVVAILLLLPLLRVLLAVVVAVVVILLLPLFLL